VRRRKEGEKKSTFNCLWGEFWKLNSEPSNFFSHYSGVMWNQLNQANGAPLLWNRWAKGKYGAQQPMPPMRGIIREFVGWNLIIDVISQIMEFDLSIKITQQILLKIFYQEVNHETKLLIRNFLFFFLVR
jgi:hypothetical protein